MKFPGTAAPAVDHFAFLVSDINVSIKFYTGVLGLSLVSKDVDEEHGEIFAFLELEGGNLELLQKTSGSSPPAKQPPEDRAYCPHLAIRSDDLDQMMASLVENGVKIIKGPLEIPGKVKWLYVSDPDGNIIEFVQWT